MWDVFLRVVECSVRVGGLRFWDCGVTAGNPQLGVGCVCGAATMPVLCVMLDGVASVARSVPCVPGVDAM